MTDIEALRARMRELAEAAKAADANPDLGALKDAYRHFQTAATPTVILALDAEITRLRDDLDRVTRERDGAYLTSQQAAQSYSNLMRVKEDIDAQRQDAEAALASPANVKALDAEITRLREDLDGVTRERDEARERAEKLAKLDREAATHVESVIAVRTGFTGDPPYVGWKGLGLALTEALDARDAAEAALAKRDEEVARLRLAAWLAEKAMDDCGDLRGTPAYEALIEALTKEPTNAE